MAFPPPTITSVNQPYWDGLSAGELRFQRCDECAHAWLPARHECPACLSPDWGWEASGGLGRIISWVVYHHPFHDSMTGRLPFNVAIVELDEGPRLITNVVTDDRLAIDQEVALNVDLEGGTHVGRFTTLTDRQHRTPTSVGKGEKQ